MKTSASDAASSLAWLLEDSGVRSDRLTGGEMLSVQEKEFLLATCCATLLVYSICHSARCDHKWASDGLDMLVTDMRRHIRDICCGGVSEIQ
jgi:hypothetical protein